MEKDREIEILTAKIESLQESLTDRALELENVGWTSLNGYQQRDDGLSLENLHSLSERLREMAATNPWHIRGAQLRSAYVFGRGIQFQKVKPAAQKILDDPHNKQVLFSADGYETCNLALFTDGNLIVTYNQNTKRFTLVPLRQITAVQVHPDDESEIQLVKREWSSNGTNQVEWYPLSRYKKSVNRLPKSITEPGRDPVPVSQTTVAYVKQSRKQAGWTWGVPDSLGAMLWTLMYSGYLKDNAVLVNALSKFAWSVTRKNGRGVNDVATKVTPPGVGGTVASDGESVLSSVGVPSAQVNFNHGQPLAAAVATSLGVPVIALLSSPGATGGSYGAATTLDAPTIQGFEAIQDTWVSFYEEILRDLGSKDASVEFPSIQNDPQYRQITSLATMVELNILHPDEVRAAALDLMDVPQLHETPPEPREQTNQNVVSGQGVAGTIPGGQNQGDTDHSLDADRE